MMGDDLGMFGGPRHSFGWHEPDEHDTIIPWIGDRSGVICSAAPHDGGEMHEIIIPMVPSKNLIGRSGWWRNSHNDRVVWRERVAEAAQGFSTVGVGAFTARVVCDWQERPKPVTTERLLNAIRSEVSDALLSVHIAACIADVQVMQSGRGKGETRISLERD